MAPKTKKSKEKQEEVIESLADKLDVLVTATNQRFGENTLMFLGRTPSMSSTYVTWSTGLFRLDRVLGNFGIVRGRFVEIWGEESSGKTTAMLQLIAEVQAIGGVCAYIDGECTLDPDYARKIGVNIDNLLISQPSNGAQALNIIDVLAQSGLVAVIVVDSVPSLIPEEMINKEIGAATIGLLARLVGPASKLLVNPCLKSNTNIIWINQVREVVDTNPMTNRGGKKLTRPGGREYRHNLSYSMFIKYIGQIKDSTQDNARIGHDIQVEVIKNKCSPPYKKTVLRIMYDEKRNLWGVNKAADLYFTALEYGLINVSGTKKIFMKKHELTKYGLGEINAIHHINEDPELQELMTDTIREIMGYPEPFFFDREQALKQVVEVEEIQLTRITDTISKEAGIDTPIRKDEDVDVDVESDFMKKLQEAIAQKEKESQSNASESIDDEDEDMSEIEEAISNIDIKDAVPPRDEVDTPPTEEPTPEPENREVNEEKVEETALSVSANSTEEDDPFEL